MANYIMKNSGQDLDETITAYKNGTIAKAKVGLGNVDNTSDLNKPISNAAQTALNAKADKVSGDGGGAIGESAMTLTGGSVGLTAASSSGGAVGSNATTNDGGAVGAFSSSGDGFAGGKNASTVESADGAFLGDGGAIGNTATTQEGGSVGHLAYSDNGGAVGCMAATSDGFAGGYHATAEDSDGVPIDAIQLGTGTNSTPKTLQVYDYPLMDAEGSIPAERLANAPKTNVIDDLTSSSAADALSAKQGKVLSETKVNNRNTDGGFEAGIDAIAGEGVAIGYSAFAGKGVSIGRGAYADDGVAIGYNSTTSDGFAGGKQAKTVDDIGGVIDAIQLGTGTNSEPKTMQVYNKRIVEADGSLTDVGKLSELNTAAKGTVVAAINELKANGGGTGEAGGGIPDLGTLDIDLLGNPDSAFTDMSSPGVYKYSWYEPNIYGDCEGILIVSYSSSATETYQVLIDSAVGMLVRYMCNSNTWNFVLDSSHVVDNLASVSGTNALSAAQGKVLKDLIDSKADKQNENGGFEGGKGASAENGAAAGDSAIAGNGGAIGYNANTGNGGAIGNYTSSLSGGAVGELANVGDGGAIGISAKANGGGAIGMNAVTGDGFAGGADAVTIDIDMEEPIDAIQLGTGTNSEPKTLQVYDYQLMDAKGKIPAERLPNLGTSKTGTLLGSGWSAGTQALSVSGLTAEQNGMISVSPSATAAQRAAARKAKLSVTGQTAGTLTVIADGKVPEIDIPVEMILL